MENNILGLHHITAIAGDAQRNHDFYTKVLGLRLVKKTVNFDDPGTYHFYFGNETGAPGTILTFFPWTHVKPGMTGAGMATEIGYSVPKNSLPFWISRFDQYKVKHENAGNRLGEECLLFQDPDGLNLNLIVPHAEDTRVPWLAPEIGEPLAIRGFHNVTLTLRNIAPTAAILTEVFGYRRHNQEGNRSRYITDAVEHARIVDLIEAPQERSGVVAGGTNHHVAFRVKDENALMQFREKIVQKGLEITEKIDRNYFYSLYFREPGGVLFEIATDNPGFATDEPVAELGTHLRLPSQYESYREKIEKILPVLQ